MRPPRQWRRPQIEPHRVSAQTRLPPHPRAEGHAAEERRDASRRGPPSPRDAAPLGRAARDARHPRVMGRAERPAARGRKATSRSAPRGSSDRLPDVPRRHTRRLWRGEHDHLGHRHLRAAGRKAERAEDTDEGHAPRRRVVIVQTRQNEGRDWLMIKHGTPPKSDPLAQKVPPMMAVAADEPFDSPDFVYEPKWDGVRTLAFVDGGEVRLQTRNLLDCTKQYPEAHAAAEALTGGYQAILDGEVVALDEKGVPSFQRLQPRMHQRDESAVARLRKSVPVVYEVFDLLYLDGEDLTRRPLRERLAKLDAALTPMGAIRRSEGFVGTGLALFAAAREQGLEGIVAKRLDPGYVPGA